MNCREFTTNLNALLDVRKDPRNDSGLQSHADDCPSCRDDLYFYAACFGISDESDVDGLEPVGVMNASRKPSTFVMAYAGISLAAATLFVLLTPISDLFFPTKNDTNHVAAAVSSPIQPPGFTNPVNSGIADSDMEKQFWPPSNLDPLINLDHLQKVLDDKSRNNLDELQKVGQSLSSVWQSMQQDEYLMPIIQQSALFWVKGGLNSNYIFHSGVGDSYNRQTFLWLPLNPEFSSRITQLAAIKWV